METVPPTSTRSASHENLQSDSRENSQSGFAIPPQQTTVPDINKIDENNNETNTATNSGTSTTENDATGGHDAFECNICFETAKDAIVTLCGHLFCWPCLHAWLEQKPPGIQTCPVCKSAVDRDRVVPLYGRGNQRATSASGSQQSKPVDPRTKTDDANNLPNRPRGQWQQAPNDQNDFFSPFFGTRPGGVHVSFGVGSFPFGFFNANIGGTVGIDNQVDPNLMSTLFLLLGMLLVAWVIFA